MTKLYEADLYEPIRKHFIKQGYRVNGEVHDCDLTAVKDEEIIIVELKLNLNIDLLLQATRRQRLTDLVYIAIPKPKRISRKRWNDIIQLVKRLELGLIIVSFSGNRKSVEFKVHPEPYKRMTSKNTRKKAALIKEIEGRSADYNIGGSTKTKIMTAYKENCIQIACYLEKLGQMSPKALVALGTGDKTPLILQKNYYKWFERVERGIYVITEQGKKELEDYPELVGYYLGGLKTEN
ncbi:DUF2161 domain-containing phosphodiesterase [Mesobacillus selenatarsenatis]|uniref:Uncharacterized protein n=1 Tax=Mesobacillus selenatarsenatis (strain DSM 18680 / JCM 14380 / FERM P-15431 / SF-1) TaxID=1321606 RepID=A0A0A8X634_MESS1|nr:DUF2161 family putative PD-(D/E)XK-type phosphodiesterase [Mesobacillus selenatarsenatis]GAM14497.1 hypothetical protein SAMD00020551_2648 [Mesobacillus selenatarsenatis SF-1]